MNTDRQPMLKKIAFSYSWLLETYKFLQVSIAIHFHDTYVKKQKDVEDDEMKGGRRVERQA
jgi:hypothetical protein